MKAFIAACLIVGAIALTADADIIYFKDGMKTICQERAWEENDQIKCEYAGAILTYRKADVMRILKTTPSQSTAKAEKKAQISQNSEAAPKIPKKTSPTHKKSTAFYDPRRPYKYWSDKNSRHQSYDEAIQALAKKYNRSPEWIQAHMGDSNDIEQINRNLGDPDLNPQIPDVSPKEEQASGIVFYNPRRPYPYLTDAAEKHKSYKQAIQALAQKYDRPPEWIQKYMGQTNDLAEIHRNLQTQLAAESPE